MLESEQIQENIKDTMIDIMAVLYERGIREIHMGAMMRLLGVNDDKASEHDGNFIQLDETFAEMLKALNKSEVPATAPPGAILH